MKELSPKPIEGELRILDIQLGDRLGFKRPRDIRQLIERHIEAISALGAVCGMVPQTSEKGGRPATEYYLNRRQAIFITAKSETAEATDITIEIIQKFDAYERGERAFADPAALLRDPETLRALLLENVQQVIGLKAKNAELTPKAEGFDRIATARYGSRCITDTAKVLQLAPKELFTFMPQNRWIYKRAGSSYWVAYQERIAGGDLEHKTGVIPKGDGSERVTTQVLVTPKGLAKLARAFGRLPPQNGELPV
jgi:phage antirepressor YoqD-like protein